MSESLHHTEATYGVHRRHLQVVRPAPSPAAEAPVPTVPAKPPVWAQRLSNREVEVLQCIAAGLSTNEIAETLFISTATVKSHVARLIMKVEVRDRLQLVVAAYRSGFVQVDDLRAAPA
jgi:DNA-binding NarL/FixJ family response regulator